jgi:hypothetical protein
MIVHKLDIIKKAIETNFILHILLGGARGGVVVKVLRYKPAGRGFDFGIFQ